jgi:hypothetical protein
VQVSKLTAATGGLRKEKNDLAGKVGLLTKELADAKQAVATAEQEMKKVQAELQEKQKENKVLELLFCSVREPPHVFGPPGSGSISQRSGSGSRSGSFPFLIKVLSGLKDCLQNKILTQNFR